MINELLERFDLSEELLLSAALYVLADAEIRDAFQNHFELPAGHLNRFCEAIKEYGVEADWIVEAFEPEYWSKSKEDDPYSHRSFEDEGLTQQQFNELYYGRWIRSKDEE